MPKTIFIILFIGFFQTRNGSSAHRIRHERTRYMSGKNQILESGQNRESSDGNFWKGPLQVLESSMDFSKKRSSRPLFSWDVPEGTGTDASSENLLLEPSSPTNSSAESTSSFDGRFLVALESVGESRLERKNEVEDFIQRKNEVFNLSNATKKGKNRKMSAEGGAKSSEKQWRNSNESVKRKRKKGGRKFGRGKTGTKRNHEGKDEIIGRKKTGSSERQQKNWEVDIGRREKQILLQGNGTEAFPNAPGKSCDLMEKKCEHICQDVDGRGVCLCYRGFRPVGTKCLAVNECGCRHGQCTRSRKCVCSPGFRLVEGVCSDVNECLLRNGHGPCQDRCTNTAGSYYCSCERLPGTRLSSDGLTCEHSAECAPESEGCTHSCVAISGRIFCTCPDGLELGDDWKTCHDVDECSSPIDYGVECPTECVNTVGSYKCSRGNETTESP